MFSLRSHTQRIASAFSWHSFIPAALAARKASTLHKVSAFMHSLALETSSADHAHEVAQAIVCFTTDYGPEVSMVDALHGEHVWSWWDVDGL